MAVILEAVRTPRGKAKPGGGLADTTPIELLQTVISSVLDRGGLDPSEVDDIIIGCATQSGEQGANIARTAALLSGLPDSVSGATVNRFCASGLDAVNLAAAKVDSGQEEVVIAGGVESVSRVPMFSDDGPLFTDPRIVRETGFVHMGIAADLVASLEGFERSQLDEYGVTTHRRAARAWVEGVFDRSLVKVSGTDLSTDEHIRPDVHLADVSSIPAAFGEIGASGMDAVALSRYPELDEIRHLHHRGNSPSLADGAGAVLVVSDRLAASLGDTPRAQIHSWANHAVEPVVMLTAGQEAVVTAADRAGMKISDVDRFEFAEAFAALCLKFQRDLDVDPDHFNANGGTIAMGHAFGATGAILVATLLDELEHSDLATGVVGISGAAGVGVATVLERV